MTLYSGSCCYMDIITDRNGEEHAVMSMPSHDLSQDTRFVSRVPLDDVDGEMPDERMLGDVSVKDLAGRGLVDLSADSNAFSQPLSIPRSERRNTRGGYSAEMDSLMTAGHSHPCSGYRTFSRGTRGHLS